MIAVSEAFSTFYSCTVGRGQAVAAFLCESVSMTPSLRGGCSGQ